jgi:hypothetical protein
VRSGTQAGAALDARRPADTRRLVGLAGRVLLALLVLVVLVRADSSAAMAAYHGWQHADGSWPRDYTSTQNLTDLRVRLAAQIPTGSRVFVAQQPVSDLWQQRIAEMLVIDGMVPTASAAQADYQISVDVPASGGPVALVVVKLR